MIEQRTWDFTLVPGANEGDPLEGHRPDCAQVQLLRSLGVPLATLFGCAELPDEVVWHDCMGLER